MMQSKDDSKEKKSIESTLIAKKVIAQNIGKLSDPKSGSLKVDTDDALLHESDAFSLTAHNEQYTTLLKAYIKDFEINSENKRNNKQELFKIAKRLLFWIPVMTILFMFVTLWCLATNRVEVLEVLPGLCAAIATLLGTFMIVPQMITEYLFNKKEEKHLAKIISKIQEYDRDIRGRL